MKGNSKSLTLYPSKRKAFLYLISTLFFTLIGVWMISDGELLGWYVSIFFGICCVVFIVALIPHSSYLRISEQGFEVCSFFRSGFTHWNEVDQFRPGYIGLNKMVVFNYSPEHQKYETGKKIAEIMTGAEGAVPDTYGKSAEELARLLNEWKEKFSK